MEKIISGGQTGVDRATLDAALDLDIQCGGFCPKGRKSEDGIIPSKYPLIETTTDQYPERTELNVKAGDGTLVIIDKQADKGTSLTISLCKQYRKPCFVVDLSKENIEETILNWLLRKNVAMLNVAGNRESFSPGIGKAAYKFLLKIFQEFL